MRIIRSKPVLIAGLAAAASKVVKAQKSKRRKSKLAGFGKVLGILGVLGGAGYAITRFRGSGNSEFEQEPVIRIPQEQAVPGV